MKKVVSILISMLIMLSCTVPEQKEQLSENSYDATGWKPDLEKTLKLFGHRNWIVIADAAYPQQSNPAIQTITVDANQLEVVEFVSQLIEKSGHVDANVFLDKEMAFVSETNAKGIESYRTGLKEILTGKNVTTMMHEDIIRELDASAKLFNVLVVKTNLALPYTSVFFKLDCGYWGAEAEESLRKEICKD